MNNLLKVTFLSFAFLFITGALNAATPVYLENDSGKAIRYVNVKDDNSPIIISDGERIKIASDGENVGILNNLHPILSTSIGTFPLKLHNWILAGIRKKLDERKKRETIVVIFVQKTRGLLWKLDIRLEEPSSQEEEWTTL
jgi:hypothetical protein